MDYDYDALAALAAVIREGGFESAAKLLGVTQSAVSQRIKHLEDRVGQILVVRGRPCVPTEGGLQLCRHLEQVVLLQHELSERLGSLEGESGASAARIRISVNNDSLASWFPSVIKRASRELGILFDVLPDDQEHTEQALKSGEALAVVTAVAEPIHGCRRMSLGSMEYIAVASRRLFDAQFAEAVSIDTIKNSRCLAFDRKDSIQEQWMMLAFGEPIQVATHLVPSYEGYLECCLNGTGWGLVPAVAAAPHLKSGRLKHLTPDISVDVPLHWQCSTRSSDVLRRLGEIVLDVARIHLKADNFRTDS